jgi:ribosome-binding protein aMBF1 (putative translation factor)
MDSYLDRWNGKKREDRERRREFGRRMVQLRQDMGLSVEEMAARLSISEEALRRIEAGKVCPDLEQYAPNLRKRIDRIAERQVLVIA